MTESSQNSNLDKEDSISDLSDSQISLLDECIENVDTSKTQTKDVIVSNIEEHQSKIIKLLSNALMQEKVEKIEAKDDCLEIEIKTLKTDAKISIQLLIDLNKKIDLFLKIDKLNIVEDNNKNYVLTTEVKQLKEGSSVCFLYVPNKWNIDSRYWICCENKCINTDRPDGFCFKGNGFIQIKSDTNIKYIDCRGDGGGDKLAQITTENSFNNPKGNCTLSQCCFNCSTATLFYYEVKFQFEKNAEVAIGLRYEENYIALWAYAKLIYYYSQGKAKKIDFPSFSLKNDDIIGCGLVYPPPKLNNNLPYLFFTQNGKQIGKAILVKEDFLTLKPYVQLRGHSVETNFGDDLNSNPFIYNISNHVTEGFYKDEEILEHAYIYYKN